MSKGDHEDKVPRARSARPPGSTTLMHPHIARCVLSLLRDQETIRVLDAGCGDGKLMDYLVRLGAHLGVDIEVWGFDVVDHGVQRVGFDRGARDHLAAVHPGIEWRSRISTISTDDPWPYGDGTFDVVVSNQVGEHVEELEAFLREQARVVRDGGWGVHVFPLGNYVVEGHVMVPWAHRIRAHDVAAAYLESCARFGVGKWSGGEGSDRARYAQRHADYLHYFTSYRRWRDVVDAARAARLRASYRWTAELYINKFRRAMGRDDEVTPYTRRSAFAEMLSFHLLKYVSSITCITEKRESYTAGRLPTSDAEGP